MPRRHHREPPPPALNLSEAASPPASPPASTWRRNLNPPPPPPSRAAQLSRDAKVKARQELTRCAMPLCERRVATHDGVGLGVCGSCALDLADWFSDLQNKPSMTERQLQRRYKELREQELLTRQMESRAMTAGWIYYLKIDERIKIGYSVDVKQRMKSYPPHAELLAVHPGTKTLEREMHDQFRNVLAAGREWFHLAPELLDHIEQVTEQFGPPDPKHIYRFREGQPSQTMKLHRSARRGANQRVR